VLPPPYRLRLRRDFAVATRRGRRAGSSTTVVHLAGPASADPLGPADPTGPATVRVGFVVSRACGPAVVRNRVRRRLRHLVLARLAQLPAGGIVVVRALPAAATASASRLEADLTRCLDRLGVRTGASS